MFKKTRKGSFKVNVNYQTQLKLPDSLKKISRIREAKTSKENNKN